MITFKVWLAAETLLYLPIYALNDLGILARVAHMTKFDRDIILEISPAPEDGDDSAIRHMLAQSVGAPESEVHVAIADPAAAFLADRTGNSVVMLGAFLKRPPFWVVGRDLPSTEMTIDHKYVYYDERFDTANFIGRRLTAELDQKHRERCAMGDEFKFFEEPEDVTGRLRVITADISGLVACQERDPSIKVQEKLMERPEFSNFLTTGILTHRRHIGSHGQALAVFLEAVRSSCVLIRTAEKPAAAVIRQLIERGAEVKPALEDATAARTLDPEIMANKIAARLFEDNVYSDTLSVEFADWAGAIKSRDWRDKRAATRLYFRIYEPREANVLTADWLISTFRDYGRFVRELRLLKGGVAGTVTALLLSQILLGVFEREAAIQGFTPRIFGALSVSSTVLAVGAIAWAALGLLMEKSQVLLPLQRLLSADENATRGIVAGLIALVVGSMALWIGRIAFHIEIAADHVILFVVVAVVGIGEYVHRIFQQRDA